MQAKRQVAILAATAASVMMAGCGPSESTSPPAPSPAETASTEATTAASAPNASGCDSGKTLVVVNGVAEITSSVNYPDKGHLVAKAKPGELLCTSGPLAHWVTSSGATITVWPVRTKKSKSGWANPDDVAEIDGDSIDPVLDDTATIISDRDDLAPHLRWRRGPGYSGGAEEGTGDLAPGQKVAADLNLVLGGWVPVRIDLGDDATEDQRRHARLAGSVNSRGEQWAWVNRLILLPPPTVEDASIPPSEVSCGDSQPTLLTSSDGAMVWAGDGVPLAGKADGFLEPDTVVCAKSDAKKKSRQNGPDRESYRAWKVTTADGVTGWTSSVDEVSFPKGWDDPQFDDAVMVLGGDNDDRAIDPSGWPNREWWRSPIGNSTHDDIGEPGDVLAADLGATITVDHGDKDAGLPGMARMVPVRFTNPANLRGYRIHANSAGELFGWVNAGAIAVSDEPPPPVQSAEPSEAEPGNEASR